jgi:hypothetical protein
LHVGDILYEEGASTPQEAGLGRDPGMKKKFVGGILLITAILILFMQIPVTEAYASSYASDFQLDILDRIAAKLPADLFDLFKESTNTTSANETEETSIASSESQVNQESTADTGSTSDTTASSEIESAAPSPSVEQILGSTHVVGNRAVLFLNNNDMFINEEGINDQSNQSISQDPNSLSLRNDGTIPKYTKVTYQGKAMIADQAYYSDNSLTTVAIPSEITEIGQFAYARSSVTQLTVPEGTQQIGYGAFYHCDDLYSVVLPASIHTVEPMAFMHTGWVDQFFLSGSDDYLIAGGVLVAYKGTADQITLPDQVRVIAADVFKDHKELKSVTLPQGLEVVGEGAFEGCTSLMTLKGGDNLKEIKDRAFQDCPLTYIRIPSTLTHIGLGAYDFSNTQKEMAQKVVVFEGITLPTLSYESTAQWLSNGAYRTTPLQDIMFAVIDKNTSENNLRDTILYSPIFPFMGIVGSITEDGFFQCRFTCINAHEFDLSSLPDSIKIGEATYPITGLDSMEYLPWTGNAVQPAGTVLFSGIEGATASLPDSQETFILQASPEADVTPMESAYRRAFQADLPENTVLYDLILTESTTGVPITNLGAREMLVTIPVPESLLGQDIRVYTLDRNGQLESVNAKVQTSNEKTQLTFMTNHFSLFAFCGDS